MYSCCIINYIDTVCCLVNEANILKQQVDKFGGIL